MVHKICMEISNCYWMCNLPTVHRDTCNCLASCSTCNFTGKLFCNHNFWDCLGMELQWMVNADTCISACRVWVVAHCNIICNLRSAHLSGAYLVRPQQHTWLIDPFSGQIWWASRFVTLLPPSKWNSRVSSSWEGPPPSEMIEAYWCRYSPEADQKGKEESQSVAASKKVMTTSKEIRSPRRNGDHGRWPEERWPQSMSTPGPSFGGNAGCPVG